MWVPIGVRYGIPMHEFYSLNPKLVLRYQPFMKLRKEKLQEDTHFDGWVFGQYIAASIGANFSKKTKYPLQPYYMMQTEDDTEEEAYVLDDVERFKIFAMTFNAEHKNLKPAVIDGEAREINPSVDSNNTESQ